MTAVQTDTSWPQLQIASRKDTLSTAIFAVIYTADVHWEYQGLFFGPKFMVDSWFRCLRTSGVHTTVYVLLYMAIGSSLD